MNEEERAAIQRAATVLGEVAERLDQEIGDAFWDIGTGSANGICGYVEGIIVGLKQHAVVAHKLVLDEINAIPEEGVVTCSDCGAELDEDDHTPEYCDGDILCAACFALQHNA